MNVDRGHPAKMVRALNFPETSLDSCIACADDVTICRWRTTVPETPDAAIPQDILVRLRTPTPSWRHRGGRAEEAAGSVGQLGVVPRGSYGSWSFVPDRPHEVTHIYFGDGFFERVSDDARGIGHFELKDRLRLDDALLARLMTEIDVALDGRDAPRLLFDGLVMAVASRLIYAHSTAGTKAVAPLAGAGYRPDWRLRRAIEFIEARLAEDLGLPELAAVVSLSASHLAALFRAGTGESPHRWLMRRRIERACEMLADPGRSVTEVAMACGFASSQHLATVFRKRMGVTPTEYRRERLS